MKYPRLTKFYQINVKLDIECLTLTSQTGKDCILLNSEGKDVKLRIETVDKMNMSRIIVLTELEEILRNKIQAVHQRLREHKIKINPISPFDVVVSPVHNPAKPVHQYDLKTARYIKTFNSVREAVRAVAPEGTSGTSNLHSVCTGKIRANGFIAKSAYGYRWSYEKVGKLGGN